MTAEREECIISGQVACLVVVVNPYPAVLTKAYDRRLNKLFNANELAVLWNPGNIPFRR